MSETSAEKAKSLGLVSLPNGTVEHDRATAEQYQAFAAELLRLALLGIGGVGFLIVHSSTKNGFITSALTAAGHGLRWAVVTFGLAAAAAVIQRYVSSDSLALHIKMMRFIAHGEDPQSRRVVGLRCRRNLMLGASFWLLVAAGVALLVALGFLYTAFSSWLAVVQNVRLGH